MLFSGDTEDLALNHTISQDSVPKTCFDCHNTLVSQKYIHAPAQESCEDCHTSNENKHPLEGTKGFDLADQSPTLCFYCHEEYSQKNIHAPAESGECLMCHNPHSSNNKALLTASSTNILCLQCHELDVPKTDFVHSPVKNGACHECHDPHQSNNNAFLKNTGSDLCFNCHKDTKTQMQAKNLHMPFEDDCFNCHQAHSTAEKGLVMEKTPTLCYNCHSDVQELVNASKSVHKVMSDKKSCSNCHSPHASNENAMLLKSGNDLCLSCHSRTYTNESGKTKNIKQALKSGNIIHAPVEDACSNCHNPHATGFSNLLINNFSAGNYAKAEEKNFALCFDCHDSGLLLTEKTTDATNFRHGENNMHFIHIQGDKGKNCNMCHDVHGAKNKFLISEKVPFGNWDMEMNFKVTEFGGSCATGCHAEKEYSRVINTVSNDSLSTVVKVQQNRYQNYSEEIYSIDSSVILANILLEEQYQRQQDSLNNLQLLAESKQDSISSNTEVLDTASSTIAVAENTIIHEESSKESENELETTNPIVAVAIKNDSLLAESNNSPVSASDTISVDDILVDNENNKPDTVIKSDQEIVVTIKDNEETKLVAHDTNFIAEVIKEDEPLEAEHRKEISTVIVKEVVDTSDESSDVNNRPAFKNISFAFAKKDVSKENEAIKAIVNWLIDNPEQSITLKGYTDSIGSEEFNYYLSLQRAESVKKSMVNLGVNKSIIKIKGLGESNPIAPNKTPQGRALNRRVEFVLVENE